MAFATTSSLKHDGEKFRLTPTLEKLHKEQFSD